jgi:putative polyhydroxyalkanoate system protein
MPQLFLSRDHSLSLDELRCRVAVMEEKLRSKYRAKTRWEDDRVLCVEGLGLSGTLTIRPSRVEIDLSLGMLLAAMRGKIEDKLSSTLERIVEPEPS